MKIFSTVNITLIFLLLCPGRLPGQNNLKESLKPGAEYNVLDIWSGTWDIQGEARDSLYGAFYPVSWTLKGNRVLNGYALEISSQWKAGEITQNGLGLIGYDPHRKIYMTNIYYDIDRSWCNSAISFTGKTTCVEHGATYYTTGKSVMWQNTWNFSEDGKSVTVKSEKLNTAGWWLTFEVKGTKITPGN